MPEAEDKSVFKLTKDTPYLTLMASDAGIILGMGTAAEGRC